MKNFEELMISLEMSLDKKAFLKSIGSKASSGYFVVVEDGSCYLFDKDGNLDNISKIKTIFESYIKKDIEKIVIPDGVKSIGNMAFYRCESLKSIKIPNSVKNIGDGAFNSCRSLISIDIPNSVKSIGDYVLNCCESLKSIEISNSVERIGNEAFYKCENLKSIKIPNSIKSIGYRAFYEYKNRKLIVFHGKTIDQVRSMENYPWGIRDESVIKCS